MIEELVAGPIEPDDAFESWFDEVSLIVAKKLTKSNLVESSSFMDEFHAESTYQVDAKIDRLRKVS